MTDDAKPRCGNCRFWDDQGDYNRPSEEQEGQCRRYPPAVSPFEDDDYSGVWPLTIRVTWCGEHQPAGQAPAEPPPFEDALVSLSGRAASALTAPRRGHYSHPECWYGLGVRSWDELRAVTASDLARVYKLWQKSVAEIREWAGRFGVRVQF